jgi:hypothetical protein
VHTKGRTGLEAAGLQRSTCGVLVFVCERDPGINPRGFLSDRVKPVVLPKLWIWGLPVQWDYYVFTHHTQRVELNEMVRLTAHSVKREIAVFSHTL